MSPRRPAALRASQSETLAEHLVAAASRLIDRRGTGGLTVHEIAREAGVADGVLYNYFDDKDDLLAQALQGHIRSVLEGVERLPKAGEGTVEDNLAAHISFGLDALGRILPAFAGVLGQPGVLERLQGHLQGAGHALPVWFAEYLRAEQRLGRIRDDADVDAAATMIIGACHEVAMPGGLRAVPASEIQVPPGFVAGLVRTLMRGIAVR